MIIADLLFQKSRKKKHAKKAQENLKKFFKRYEMTRDAFEDIPLPDSVRDFG